MALTPAQQRYLLIGQGLIPAAVNLVLNGALAWFFFRGVDPIPAWGWASAVGPDLLITGYCLPAITCLIVTPIARWDVRRSVVSATQTVPFWLRPFRRALLIRTVLFGLAGLMTVGVASAGWLTLFGPDRLPLTFFVGFKAVYCAIYAALITPCIARVALADTPSLRESEEPAEPPA